MKPWHLKFKDGSTAFVQEDELSSWLKLVLYCRGWRKVHWSWWSKRSPRRKAADDRHNAYFGYTWSFKELFAAELDFLRALARHKR